MGMLFPAREPRIRMASTCTPRRHLLAKLTDWDSFSCGSSGNTRSAESIAKSAQWEFGSDDASSIADTSFSVSQSIFRVY
mmetsp:Transcript_3956/g.6012  ORF Transcript_3956/g.6012 Transcript_3956/m.6012 type:complete len:80 (+) Transcript_3956:575-814(+)